jgi:hypothetical protein
MELVLLDGLFSEGDNLSFGLSLILWKGHPLANDFAPRLVVFFHVRGSLAYLSERHSSSRPRPSGNINTTFAPEEVGWLRARHSVGGTAITQGPLRSV